TYLIVFGVIFIETGAVIMPFLPGDSLLFAASALSASSEYYINIWLFIILFWLASVTGDLLNYFIGHIVERSVSQHHFSCKFIKEVNMNKTEAFFEKHWCIAISLVRFMPIIRT